MVQAFSSITKWKGIGTEVFVANHRVVGDCATTAGELVFDPTSTLVGSLQECYSYCYS